MSKSKEVAKVRDSNLAPWLTKDPSENISGKGLNVDPDRWADVDNLKGKEIKTASTRYSYTTFTSLATSFGLATATLVASVSLTPTFSPLLIAGVVIAELLVPISVGNKVKSNRKFQEDTLKARGDLVILWRVPETISERWEKVVSLCKQAYLATDSDIDPLAVADTAATLRDEQAHIVRAWQNTCKQVGWNLQEEPDLSKKAAPPLIIEAYQDLDEVTADILKRGEDLHTKVEESKQEKLVAEHIEGQLPETAAIAALNRERRDPLVKELENQSEV